MEFLKAIIRPSYWYTHQYPVPEAWSLGLTIFFGALVLIGIVATVLSLLEKRFRKPWRTFFSKLAIWGWVMGLLGLSLLFFSVQRIWLISARGFYLIWFALAAYWLYGLLKYLVKDIPRLISEQSVRMEAGKYLPKRKK